MNDLLKVNTLTKSLCRRQTLFLKEQQYVKCQYCINRVFEGSEDKI